MGRRIYLRWAVGAGDAGGEAVSVSCSSQVSVSPVLVGDWGSG